MKEAMQDVVREKLESVRAELEGPGDTATEKQLDSPISVTPTRTGIHRFGPCVLAEVKNEIKVLIWIRPREKEVRPPYPEGFSLDILVRSSGYRGDMNPVGFFGMHFEVSQILTGSCAWLFV